MFRPDPKPAPRRTDELAGKRALLRRPRCCICGNPASNAHHIVKRSQGGDDFDANFASVCGTGTSGCHGLIETRDPVALAALTRHIIERKDTMRYLIDKLGGLERADAWCRRNLTIWDDR